MKKISRMIILLILILLFFSLDVFAEENGGMNLDNWAKADGAYYKESEGAFILTEDNTTWVHGSIWCVNAYYEDFTLELDYYTGVSDRPLGGADGIAIAFYSNYDYQKGYGEELGFNGSNGYGIELDTYCNYAQNDPNYNHISLIKERVGNHLITERLDESEDGMWHHLKVEVQDLNCSVYVDDNLKFTYGVEPTGYGWIGITSATGTGTNKHAVKNISVTGQTDYESQLLELTLNHELINSNYKKEGSDKEYYEYRITARAKNGMTVTAGDCSVALDVSNSAVEISNETMKEIAIGDVVSGEEIEQQWTIYIPKTEELAQIEYSVTFDIEKIVDLKQSGRILLENEKKNDNSIIFGKDQWNFSNSDSYYNPKGNENYYLTDNDYIAFVSNLDNLTKDIIDKKLSKGWAGSCYGMSATTILTKMGIIDPSSVQEGKTSLYEINMKNNDTVESMINFYHMQQYLNPPLIDRIKFMERSAIEQLNIIGELAEAVNKGGSPFMLSFSGKKGGHAVVGYGIEHGFYSVKIDDEILDNNPYEDTVGGNIIADTNRYYDSRILIYDCNYPDGSESSYLYYNQGTDEWVIPNYYDYNQLIQACADIEIMDNLNHHIEMENSIARIYTQGQLEFLLYYKDRYEKITPETHLVDEKIFSIFDDNAVLDEDGNIVAADKMTVTLPSMTESYMIKPANKDDICNYDLVYENISLGAISDKAEAITFTPNGKVSVAGNNGKYELSICANEGYYSLPWYSIKVSGADSSDISLEQTEEGILVVGSNLKNVSVTAENRKETRTLDFSTEQKKALISSETVGETEILVIKIDKNDDGTFETILENITGIVLDKNKITLKKGNSETLKATIEPENALNKNIIWSSSDENIVSVSQSGVVTAKNVGNVIITAKTEQGEFNDTCEVTVIDVGSDVIEQEKTPTSESNEKTPTDNNESNSFVQSTNLPESESTATVIDSKNTTGSQGSQTGDSSLLEFYLILVTVSFCIFLISFVYQYKKKR